MANAEPKIPKRVESIIERCRSGETLCKTFRHKESGETEVLYHFHPSGRSAGPKSAAAAVGTGLLRPSADGLFGADTAQTWRAARP